MSSMCQCSKMVEMFTENLNLRMKIKVGTPPVEIKIIPIIGYYQSGQCPQWILDSNAKDSIVGQQLIFQGQKDFYNYEKSTTAKLGEFATFTSPNNDMEQYQGYNDEDIIELNGLQFKSQFTAVDQITNISSDFQNGIMYFQKSTDNFVDLLYYQEIIKYREYILSGISVYVQSQTGTYFEQKYFIDLEYDFDGSESYYNLPSSELTSDPNQSILMSYGIYLNGEDITDKLKYRKINIGSISPYSSIGNLGLPSDIIEYLQPYVSEIGYQGITNCKDCQCQEIQSLPVIKLITNQYIFEITPNDYTQYWRDEQDTCIVSLNYSSDNSYDLVSSLLFNHKIKIMYEKNNNSVRLTGLQSINHINMKRVIIVFSILNGLIFCMLIAIAYQYIQQFKSAKIEQSIYLKLIMNKFN